MPPINKRLRIMAGPNGSGKSTILKEVRKAFYSGPYVNADEIQEELDKSGSLDLEQFQVDSEIKNFQRFVREQGKSWIGPDTEITNVPAIEIKHGKLKAHGEPNAYLSDIL